MFRVLILTSFLFGFVSCQADTAPKNEHINNHEETSAISEDIISKPILDTAELPTTSAKEPQEVVKKISNTPDVPKNVRPQTTKVKKSEIEPKPIEKKQEITTEAATEEPIKEVTEEIKEETEELPKEKTPEMVAPSHDQWNQLLQKYVNAKGDVNYAGFKSNKAALQSYLDLLAKNPPQNSWSRNEQLAYWINAYNAYTVKLIVDNYPINSIMDLHGGKPWDVKWIKLGDKTYSLNNIENDIIRPKFNEARIHFAVNCAAASCPPLLNQAFTATRLNSQLEKQTRSFINNTSYNQIKSGEVQISKIFEWYKSDFGSSLIGYLNPYTEVDIKKNAKVKYKEYNWSLNKQ